MRVLLLGALLLTACDPPCNEEVATDILIAEMHSTARNCSIDPLEQVPSQCSKLMQEAEGYYQLSGRTHAVCGRVKVKVEHIVTEGRRASITYRQQLEMDRNLIQACGEALHLPSNRGTTEYTRQAFLDDSGVWRLEG